MKDLIKADVQRLTPDQLVGKAGHIVDSMTGNLGFPTPEPKLIDVTAAQNTLVQAIEDAKSSRAPRSWRKMWLRRPCVICWPTLPHTSI